jgi:hypothetical protein
MFFKQSIDRYRQNMPFSAASPDKASGNFSRGQRKATAPAASGRLASRPGQPEGR